MRDFVALILAFLICATATAQTENAIVVDVGSLRAVQTDADSQLYISSVADGKHRLRLQFGTIVTEQVVTVSSSSIAFRQVIALWLCVCIIVKYILRAKIAITMFVPLHSFIKVCSIK